MATKSVPLKDICLDGGTQHRPLNEDIVKRYAALMKDGVQFPAVEIIIDGKNKYLIDGFHRLAATRKNGKKYIEAFVVNGTRREAIFLSFGANKENAFPRQPGTAKGIVEKILKDAEWSKISQREIARHVGVTEGFVRKVKNESKAHVRTGTQIDSGSEPKNKDSRSKTVNIKRGESEYEAKVPEKKVLDSTGKQVPEHLVKYFERANEYRQMIKQLNDMLKTVRDGTNICVKCGLEFSEPRVCQTDDRYCHGDLFYKFIKIENLTAEVGNVKRIFRFAMPFAICGYCGADENNAECRACDGAGFVNEATYRATPEDLK